MCLTQIVVWFVARLQLVTLWVTQGTGTPMRLLELRVDVNTGADADVVHRPQVTRMRTQEVVTSAYCDTA
jgi:hypothetical protein